jgi:preprotein translocase subunit SecB
MADQQPTTPAQKQLLLQKIYVKDLSFESPKAPMVFTTNVAPQTQLNVRSSAKEVAQDTHEVTLTITVEAKDKDSTLFLAEVAQSGIFLIQGYNAEERSILIGSFCPNTLYPFARETIADLVTKGGFPQLLLQPLNFDAIYAQAVQERAIRASNAAAPAAAAAAAAAPATAGGETH